MKVLNFHCEINAALKNTPICESLEKNLKYLAKYLDKYSGADINEVCQRAVKYAIRESVERKKTLTDNNEIDPVPKLLPKHFELAMEEARRSVTDADIMKYEGFAQKFASNKLGEIETGTKFKFPTGEFLSTLNEDMLDDECSINSDCDLYD